jgi:hypothetical protein
MLEDDALVRGSVRDIRELLTEAVVGLPEDSTATPLLLALRDRTNRYLTVVDNLPDEVEKWERVREELIELRAAVQRVLASLAQTYDLPAAADLAGQIARELRWGFPGPSRVFRVQPKHETVPSAAPNGSSQRRPHPLRTVRRWFGDRHPRIIDTVIAGIIVAIIGGGVVALVFGGSGGDHHSASSPPAPATPSAPPKGVRTYAETPGGTVHTWADYATAEGAAGPLIPAHATVQIACKVGGFKVQDGDTWWYRIESAPWYGEYYGSADAFYNNGRRSGPLHGTPFVDKRVPDC